MALDQLNAAFDTYLHLEALADARRVGRALRGLSVERRIVTHPRANTGGESLTDSELKVVHLIAQGVTNRSVATQLHLIPCGAARTWGAAAGTQRRRPLVAREHNEHNVDSASPVPEHVSNEPFFDSRDEATAERLDILNDRSTARSPARGNPGYQLRPRVKRALMLAR